MRCKRFEPVRAIERPPDAVPCFQDCIGAVERPRGRHSVRPPGRPATAPQLARGRRRIERVQRVERHRRQPPVARSEEHTSELQSRRDLVCRLLLEKKKKKTYINPRINSEKSQLIILNTTMKYRTIDMNFDP